MNFRLLIGMIAACGLALSPAAARADAVWAKPVIWHVKAKDGHGQATLFGSLHILPANLHWLTPDILYAIQHSQVFVFEVPTDASALYRLRNLIAANGSLPEGQSLRALLPPQSQSDYDSAIAMAHLSPSVTDREKPWLVSMQLNLATITSRNYFPEAGVDYVLMAWANDHFRSVRYLETIEQQFALLNPGDNDAPLADFEMGLKNYGAAKDTTQPLVQAWSEGDIAKLGALMDAYFAGHPDARQRLLTDRDRQWANQIEKMLSDNRSVFITVGAAHLAGPDGVPALLRQDGYIVEGP